MVAVAVAVAVPMAVPVTVAMPVSVPAMIVVIVGVVVVVMVVVVVRHQRLCLTEAAPDQCGLRPTSASARRVTADSLADQSTINASISGPLASLGT